MLAEQRQQLGFGQFKADPVVLGIALGQVFEPEVVVEVQVEQGAVHIQQHGVDGVPGQQHGKCPVGLCGVSRFVALSS